MPEPFAFRTPIAIPEIGADAGDWIEYDPEDPDLVYVIREIPKRAALDAFNRLRCLFSALPSDYGAERLPQLRRLK